MNTRTTERTLRRAVNKEIEVGIVGLGKMGIAHMAILNALEGARVSAVAEKQALVRHSVGSVMRRVRLYEDYERMLDGERLDAVWITAPTALHVKVAMECAGRGIPFFVEKPLGLTGRESAPLVAAARAGDTASMVGYCKHFVDTFMRAREIISGGSLGRPIYFSSFVYVSQLFSEGSGWRYKKESSGGGVLNILATHLVDLLFWLFGEVEYVTSGMKSHYSKEVEDFAHSYLVFRSGLEGYVDASWSIRNYRLPEIYIEVQCENGMLAVTEDYLKYQVDSEGTMRTLYKQDLFRGVEVYVGGAEYTREDRHFVDCLRSAREPEIDAEYGFKVQCVTDCMYDSAVGRKSLEVDYEVDRG